MEQKIKGRFGSSWRLLIEHQSEVLSVRADNAVIQKDALLEAVSIHVYELTDALARVHPVQMPRLRREAKNVESCLHAEGVR